MAKFQEPSDDTKKIFNQAFVATGISNFLKLTLLVNNTAKQIFKVTKANDVLNFRTGDDVFIVINEVIFDQLTDEHKRIVAEEALAHVSFDTESDKVILSSPDFVAHSGILRKHSFQTIEVVRQSISSLYNAQKEKDAEDVQTTESL